MSLLSYWKYAMQYITIYADDLVLLAPSWTAMQLLLNICVNSVTSLDMKFNASKSVSMIYAPYNVNKRVQFIYPNFKLNDDLIATVDNVKYLGHLIATDNDGRDIITRPMSLLYARTNFIIRKFAECSTDVKKCLLRAYCINFYGIALWDNYPVTVINKFEASYFECIQLFLGLVDAIVLLACFSLYTCQLPIRSFKMQN